MLEVARMFVIALITAAVCVGGWILVSRGGRDEAPENLKENVMAQPKPITVEANLGNASWAAPNGRGGTFRPKGNVTVAGREGYLKNPESWESGEPMLSARLFVGFNVGAKPTYDVDDLIRVVRRVREEQGEAPDASFLLQKGIYTSYVDKSVVEENGAQVIILNTSDEPLKAFRDKMVDLAEHVARDLQQETVIVELQRGGLAVRTMGIVP